MNVDLVDKKFVILQECGLKCRNECEDFVGV